MAGEKEKKGFSGLSGLASEISDINEPIKPEPKEEGIKDSDVKKESREASQSAGVSIDPTRALPAHDTVGHGDNSSESEANRANEPFVLMIVLLICIGLGYSVFNSLSNAKSDRVGISRGTEGSSRRVEYETDNSSMNFPKNISPDKSALQRELPQENIMSQNSQGSVVSPKTEGKFSTKKNESDAHAASGRKEDRRLFGGNERGQARLKCVDNGFVVLSDGSRYSITGLSGVDFAYLMRNHDAKSIGFKIPVRFIGQERTWWDRSLNYSRKAKLFAKSGTTIILLSKGNNYHNVEYSNLSANDRRYIDSVEFSRTLKNDSFIENSDPFDHDTTLLGYP